MALHFFKARSRQGIRYLPWGSETFAILDVSKRNAKGFTLDVCEVNPRKKGADETVRLAREVILKLTL